MAKLLTWEEARRLPQPDVRRQVRSSGYCGHTTGLATDRLQCNLAILPVDYARDFLVYCQRNPKPCPLVAVSGIGDPMLATLGADVDVRTDVPQYNVYRHGELDEQVTDIGDLWRPDYVAFAIGCSFTFEQALLEAGIALRHLEEATLVPMYRTSVETVPAGPFRGGMVVSMRPIPRCDIDRAVAVTGRFPWAHGEPVQVGNPAAIGIPDIDAPNWGDPIEVRDDEQPVFWACGVTPQNALLAAKPPICITHTPGRMLITDIAGTARPPAWASPF